MQNPNKQNWNFQRSMQFNTRETQLALAGNYIWHQKSVLWAYISDSRTCLILRTFSGMELTGSTFHSGRRFQTLTPVNRLSNINSNITAITSNSIAVRFLRFLNKPFAFRLADSDLHCLPPQMLIATCTHLRFLSRYRCFALADPGGPGGPGPPPLPPRFVQNHAVFRQF